jgi:hypothetical protein
MSLQNLVPPSKVIHDLSRPLVPTTATTNHTAAPIMTPPPATTPSAIQVARDFIRSKFPLSAHSSKSGSPDCRSSLQ